MDVTTPTAPDFQNNTMRLAQDLKAKGICPPPHRGAIGHPSIKRGEAGIGDFLLGKGMAHIIAHCVAPFVRSLPAVNSDEEFPLGPFYMIKIISPGSHLWLSLTFGVRITPDHCDVVNVANGVSDDRDGTAISLDRWSSRIQRTVAAPCDRRRAGSAWRRRRRGRV